MRLNTFSKIKEASVLKLRFEIFIHNFAGYMSKKYVDKLKLELELRRFVRSKKKIQELSLNILSNDVCCPGCKEWVSNLDAEYNGAFECLSTVNDDMYPGGYAYYKDVVFFDNEHVPNGLKITCPKCREVSYWTWGIIPGYSRIDVSGNLL